MLFVINVNYPQTRKSSTHGSLHSVTNKMDEASQQKATEILREKKRLEARGRRRRDGEGSDEEADGGDPAVRVQARVFSATLTSFR